MLTAIASDRSSRLALPDYQSSDELESVRDRARCGELLCPVCSQELWLRAGQIRIPHFSHRILNNCQHSSVSEAVLTARSLIYAFSRAVLRLGKSLAT
jgi:competence CoiA-like predicted nuclease